MIVNKDFDRISYTDAFNILKNSKPNKKGKFKFKVDEWGIDLSVRTRKISCRKTF